MPPAVAAPGKTLRAVGVWRFRVQGSGGLRGFGGFRVWGFEGLGFRVFGGFWG